jgi:hypothetical protein
VPADRRQAIAARVIGRLEDLSQSSMSSVSTRFATGFHASAIDLGALQQVIERGISRFDDLQLAERWSEIHDWIQRVLRAWVQRRKKVKIQRLAMGIRIELETQDDLGYYSYAFDVFPRNGRVRK